MLNWISNFWHEMSWLQVALAIIGIVVTFAGSYVIVSIVLVKMPADYFKSDYEHHFLPDTRPLLRNIAIVGKNLLGGIMILAGIVLSLPAVPGPGLITIFIGIMITDIPGKRRMEAAIIRRRAILSAINKLRTRYDRPNLVID